jgi:hypothetical protein
MRSRRSLLHSLAEILLISLTIPSHPELVLLIRTVPADRFKQILQTDSIRVGVLAGYKGLLSEARRSQILAQRESRPTRAGRRLREKC